MSRRTRFTAFLYSRRNIAGSLLALGGLGLFFAGILTGPLWIPVVCGLYAIGVLLVPGEPQLDLRLDAAADASQIRAGLDRLLTSIQGRVADDIVAEVRSIQDSIEATVAARPVGLSSADLNVYLIRQTALDYLPRALSAYLALPRTFAERRTVEDGRTAHDELSDQLRLLNTKMQEVAYDIARKDSDRLFANGRFLAEKFADSSLDVGTGNATVPAEMPAAALASSVPAAVRVPIATVLVDQTVPVHPGEYEVEREHAR